MILRLNCVLVGILCIGIFLMDVQPVCADDNENQHTTFVLFGATGNLATTHLWQSIFDIYSNKVSASVRKDGVDRPSNHSFSFMGVGTSAQEKGITLLNSKLADNINCDLGYIEMSSLLTDCEERKRNFISSIEYVQFVDDSKGYTNLCNRIQKTVSSTSSTNKKMKVIMYMSISTTAYVSVLENFKTICHKKILHPDVNIRWALEKPFGVDKMTAHTFADQIQNSFDENEIYHVDHYLQKSVVKTILQFRYLNKDLDKVWNRHNIDRVEIFLKETLDVQGRVSFYNTMGVLRDIHQNHLTELLVLVSMELPVHIDDATEISRQKADLIRQVESVKSHNAVFGQYADYAKHVSLEMTNDTKSSDVPTFAAVVVRINSVRWKDVPFILVSGKHLDQRESFVRVVFKDRNICVSKCGSFYDQQDLMPQIVFHIGHGDINRPAILVSKSFGKPIWPDNVINDDGGHSKTSGSDLFRTDVVYQTSINQFFVGVVVKNLPAYHSVVSDLVEGVGSHFVTTRQLLLSWHIWDFIITVDKSLRIYQEGDIYGVLNFRFDGENRLEFLHDDLNLNIDKEKIEKSKYHKSATIDMEKYNKEYSDQEIHQSGSETPALFLGWKLVTATSSQLSSLLTDAIADIAKQEVKIKGSFHIALSGGSSIAPVLNSLANSHFSLPWDSIHVWQVDERCVHHYDDQSNFGILDRELFRHVNIPFPNIHAMPVDIAGDLCDESLGGSHVYTESIKNHVVNSRFDVVVLGLGTDGHTASLFPGSTALHVDSDTFVTMTDDGPTADGATSRRMTLTLPIINRSKHIAILATGPRKRDILKRLEFSSSFDKYPILGVRPNNGTVKWYIDDLALS